MDQNQTVDNDLQKAIDDITNTTNVDPVFSDPVAAPSSVPEGDTGELDEPVGPFPEPKVEMVTPGPEPIAPFEPIDIPDLSAPTPATPSMPPMPEPTVQPAPTPEPTPSVAPTTFNTTAPAPAGLNTHQVKEAALRDLIPLLDHINMTPSQKFNICRNIFEDLRDYTVLEQAYRAASEIPDETERAEALLYLVESIDKM
ncbi:hypothetical protein [Candidatus Nanosyncoccus alces]|uniref:Uncharacterized protein n=1 Tax=Candidatus Nanosyncoccus alces TaxID=2171997 RepID=A0ABY0FM42_9BACT|nr:hypothetical protein [Candidatus Nanosyncoccus alces]RYC74941.1 hypothetical protein G3RUM_00218 [Candidatus Nanosyncoccus alces]